jgi:dTMP kinase
MQSKEGVFIAIEGTDGSGKGTQFKLLVERLEQSGYDVATFDFPRYDEPSSYFIKQYLNGSYGSADEVGPYTASLFYALDRYAASTQIREALNKGKVVISNRYVGSNMAHQGTKFGHAEQRRGYFIWLDNLEFELLHIPRPTLSVVLRVPADVAQGLVDKKEQRDYTNKKRDIHEADLSHLERSVEVYDDLCQLFPKDFSRIDCVRGGELLAVDVINNLLWEKISPLLPTEPRHNAAPAKAERNEDTISDKVRSTGPTSVQLSIEQGSSLLNTRLALTRSGAHVTTGLHAGRYDQKDEHGQFKYYTPGNLKGQALQDFRDKMDEIFENYSTIVHQLTQYIREHSSSKPERNAAWKRATSRQAMQVAQAVLPVSTRTTTNLTAAPHDLEHLISQLSSDVMPEVQEAALQLLEQARRAVPTFMEQFVPSEAKSRPSTLKQLAETYLPDSYAASFTEPVTLTDFWPRNELDLVPDMLYRHSNLPLTELKREIDTWPYERKAEVLSAYIAQQTQALEKAHYGWDFVSDYASFTDSLQFRLVDDLAWQQLTPRLGYEVPSLIEDAGLADMFEECFDISLEVHSLLHEAGLGLEAQYATLLGHRMRWKATYNAYEILHMHVKTNTEISRLLHQMHEKVAEVHPMIAGTLQIKNKTK